MLAPTPDPLTLDLVRARLSWLTRHGGTLTFRHENGKTYVDVEVTDCDRERVKVSVCVNGGFESEHDAVRRTVIAIGICEEAEREVGRMPF